MYIVARKSFEPHKMYFLVHNSSAYQLFTALIFEKRNSCRNVLTNAYGI